MSVVALVVLAASRTFGTRTTDKFLFTRYSPGTREVECFADANQLEHGMSISLGRFPGNGSIVRADQQSMLTTQGNLSQRTFNAVASLGKM